MKRYIWILICFLGISAYATTEERKENFTAVLPDGTTIELVGLRNYSILDLQQFKDRNYPWWRPDGTAIVEPPDTFKGRTSSAGSYWFVIRVREGINHDFKAVGPYGRDLTVQPVRRKAQGFEKDDLRHFSLRFSSNQKEADIKLGLATGDWKVTDRWSIEPDWTPYNLTIGSADQLILRCPEQVDSDVVAEVTQVITERATRLVLFDKDGNQYESEGDIRGEGVGLVRHVHRFKNLDRSSIEHIEFQARPYEYWITFCNVSLQMGQKTQVEVDLTKPGTLLPGEALPNFNGIKIDFPAQDSKNKMLLVCFFDMQQRPSRNCLQHLSKRAQELKAKDIVVVAVQTSKIDESKLNEWIKKYNIPFPVGMIEGDEEKIRFIWGVRSLPWLILTDPEHIVRSNGFSLAELNEKIKEAEIRGDALSNTNFIVKSEKMTKVTIRANKSSGLRRITGVVRDEKGELVSDAIVSTRLDMSKNTITNTEGRFTLKCKPKDTLRPREDTTYLIVRHKERNLAATVEFDDDNAETLDIRLTPGVIFSGKVIDIEGRGIPDADLFVTFHVSRLGIGGREVTNIDAQGDYEIRAVPSGHKFSVSASAEGYGEQYVKAHTAEAVDGRIELDPLVLAIANLSISGIAVDIDDKPVAEARISCYGEGQPSHRTQTNEDGRFTLKHVCAGRIEIRAQKGGQTRLRGYLETKGGAKDVRILMAELDARGRPVPKQPPSLVGKSLPDLNSIRTDLIPEQVKGKMILVCFFDMQQRPSRNCIMQLAKRAEELKRKGITVVAVQASKIDENKLNEWIKKYNIPFPVGMIEGDEEKIRFTWGVKSLPWLILTDKKHIVRTEGFALSELDEKTKQISKAKGD